MTEDHHKVLGILAKAKAPIHRDELAKQTNLSIEGVSIILADLKKWGFASMGEGNTN